MAKSFNCWKYTAELQNVILPMSRREECQHCSADQHVCKMCKHFDHRQRCSEDRAESVSNTEKANFCDYFSPLEKVFNKTDSKEALVANAKLAALFGEDPEDSSHINPNADKKQLTPAEIAEQKLRDLLG